MAYASMSGVILRGFRRFNAHDKFIRVRKLLYCTKEIEESEPKKELSGFASSFIKQIKLKEDVPEKFTTLLRKSKFIDLGDPEGKIVVGTIYHVVQDDLYIDFGWKFPTVCTRPKVNEDLYVKGVKVKLLVKDLELSSRFLGMDTDISLGEADCILLGLYRSSNSNL